MTRHRAFTLPEVMVAAVLSLLVIGLTTTLLLPALQVTMRGHAMADMQQEAMIALRNLQDDLQRCAPDSLSLSQDADHVTLAAMPLVDVDQNGNQDWLGGQVAYVWTSADATLRRVSWQPPAGTDPTVPLQLDPPTLAALASNPTLPTHVVARGVTAFSIANAGPITQGGPVSITITLSRTTPRPEQFQCQCLVACRNTTE